MYRANNNTMRNGGSPPTHLPSSSLSDHEEWLQIKWLQPPPRAPNWLFASYQAYNPPPGVGPSLPWEEWHQHAFREDQQAAGLLPPALLGGTPLCAAHARAERAYKAWKWAINNLWAEECHCQQLLDEQAARACLEAAPARASQETAAAHARQEAACRQQLLHEQKETGRIYTTRLFAQCVAEDHAAGLLFAKRLFAWCVDAVRRSAEHSPQE
jgi:hypothetical protein